MYIQILQNQVVSMDNFHDVDKMKSLFVGEECIHISKKCNHIPNSAL